MQHDAELSDVTTHKFENGTEIAFGRIWNDTSTHGFHPFLSGRQIRTSPIQERVEVDGNSYIVTLNTTYKVLIDAPTETEQHPDFTPAIALS